VRIKAWSNNPTLGERTCTKICTIQDIGEQDDGHALSWRDANRVLFIAAAGGPAPQKFLSRARQDPNSH
jgi:hypothetical protein